MGTSSRDRHHGDIGRSKGDRLGRGVRFLQVPAVPVIVHHGLLPRRRSSSPDHPRQARLACRQDRSPPAEQSTPRPHSPGQKERPPRFVALRNASEAPSFSMRTMLRRRDTMRRPQCGDATAPAKGSSGTGLPRPPSDITGVSLVEHPSGLAGSREVGSGRAVASLGCFCGDVSLADVFGDGLS